MNKVIINGRLGKDPELRKSSSGNEWLSFSLAVNEFYKGENHTTWVDFSAFGKSAELIAKHCKKGDMLLVDGSLSVRKVPKDETTRTYYSVTVQRVEFLPRGDKTTSRPQEKPQKHEQQNDDIPF